MSRRSTRRRHGGRGEAAPSIPTPAGSEARFYHFAETGKLTRVATVAAAQAAARQGGFVWLDYCHPTKEELTALIAPFGLHRLSIEDCTDDDQVPKISDFPHYTFVLFNAFSSANDTVAVDEVDLFIGANFLISVGGYGLDLRRTLADIEHLVEQEPESARQGPAFLLHVILDHLVDRKMAAIDTLDDELDRAEEAVLTDVSHFGPAALLRLRRELLALRKSLFHEREILVKICRRDCPFIPEPMIFQYRDIYDHLTKFLELTEASRDVVTSLMEMYLSLLNNQMAKAANDTNATIRRLTFITTIFMPLSFLAGVGGMSEWSMMTGPEHWPIAYPAFLLAMVVVAVASYYLLAWLEQLDRGPGRPLGGG